MLPIQERNRHILQMRKEGLTQREVAERFWSVVNGLTVMDMGSRCNEEWRKRLVVVKQQSGIIGLTPYSSAR